MASPAVHHLKWTGQYEPLERVRERLAYILPLTIGIGFVILYLSFGGAAQTLLVMTGVPFAAVGTIWTLYVAGFNTSSAVWVGMLALLGVAAETASMWGGLVSLTLLTLLVIPAMSVVWRGFQLRRAAPQGTLWCPAPAAPPGRICATC